MSFSAALVTMTLVAIVVVLVVAVVVWAWRRDRDRTAAAKARRPWDAPPGARGSRIVLDLDAPDPDDPAVQRLVRDAAHRTLRADPAIDEVTVVAPDGRVLGHVVRPGPLGPEVTLPEALREPHAPTRHAPSPVPHDDLHTRTRHETSPELRRAPLADRLELPPAVRARIVDPTRAVDVIRAILEVAGRPVQVDGDLLLSDDVAIVVIDPRPDPDRALTHGYLRVEASPASRGIVLRVGYVDPALVRRREAAARHVRHVGPDALQRMADAVAAGGDPVAFAVAADHV